jgi:peptidoglycan/LPS O-acetylase OafA/YrhL
MSSNAGEQQDTKLLGLEVPRFLAAIAILIHHYPYFSIAESSGGANTLANLPFRALLDPIYTQGWAAVQLFWCISGFIFAWKYSGPIGAGAVSFRRFAVLRLSRLYPLHLVTLLSVAVLQMIYLRAHGTTFLYDINDRWHFCLNLLFAQYWGFEDGMSFNGPSWSVSLELLVYVLFFASCRLIGRRTRLALPVAFAIYFVSVQAYSSNLWQFAGFQAAGYFWLGVLACHLYKFIVVQNRPTRIMFACMAFLIACGPLALMHLGLLDSERPNPMIWAAVILLSLLCIGNRGARVNRVVTRLGDLTYGSYLLHFPLQLAIVQLIALIGARTEDLVPQPEFFLAYIVLTLALSRIVFVHFERPAQYALRSALLRRREVSYPKGAALESGPGRPLLPDDGIRRHSTGDA